MCACLANAAGDEGNGSRVQLPGQGQSLGPVLQLHAHVQGSCRVAAPQEALLFIPVSVSPVSCCSHASSEVRSQCQDNGCQHMSV